MQSIDWSKIVLPAKNKIFLDSTPCDEINIELVFEISQQLEGVRSSPAGFGLLSEGTYLSFKGFGKSF